MDPLRYCHLSKVKKSDTEAVMTQSPVMTRAAQAMRFTGNFRSLCDFLRLLAFYVSFPKVFGRLVSLG